MLLRDVTTVHLSMSLPFIQITENNLYGKIPELLVIISFSVFCLLLQGSLFPGVLSAILHFIESYFGMWILSVKYDHNNCYVI